MKIYLLRHGETTYNVEKRYQGIMDIPLSPKGRAELTQADFSPAVVYVSPLSRARETARILFPQAQQIVVPDLREMCFGIFQGKNFPELADNPVYSAWVNANCETPCPGGESKPEFCDRSCAAFEALVNQAFAERQPQLVILAHGGTQMAVMERYALPHRDYNTWCGPNAGGYLLEADEDSWHRSHQLLLVGLPRYTQKGGSR